MAANNVAHPAGPPAVAAAPPPITVMGHDEKKHWSKALAQILRHGPGKDATPPRSLPLATLVRIVRSSGRFGQFSETKLWQTLEGNGRFSTTWTTDAVTGWSMQYVTAL